jgi:sulfide:quinone oxidoreductase
VEAIDPVERTADVGGARLRSDALIIALGAEQDPGAVTGFQEYGHNAYSVGDLAETARALREFEGGRLLVGVMGEPHPCPPAPYEMAYLLRDFYQERDVEVDLGVFTPKPSSLPIAGEAGCMIIEDRLEARDIEFLPNRRALEVESGTIQFSTAREDFDLLLGIPQHRAPDVVVEAGLTGESGWIEPDPKTLQTEYEGVYAIGDLTSIKMANGKALPMAGVFAETQGVAAAEDIAAMIQGRESQAAFEGEGGCFLEVGQGKAVQVQGHLLAEAGPEVEVSEPTTAQLEAKHEFEQERLQRWFGS